MPKAPDNLREFAGLVEVVKCLRGPDGCPWDKEQTHSTLTRYALEEAFELSEAADSGDKSALREELGDLLLQVILHAEIACQEGTFDINDVIETISQKMVRRHPHVFSDVVVKDSTEVLRNWSAIKDQEKGRVAGVKGRAGAIAGQVIDFDIPPAMPALLRSQKIGEKTKHFDFDWKNAAHCWPKIKEEVAELEEAMAASAHSDTISAEMNATESELGDVLFSLAQLARHLHLDSEQALRKANRRFETRFWRMLDLVTRDGKVWAEIAAAERESYWKRAKVSTP